MDNQVTWPKEEALITVEQYRLVLMPKTKDHLQSVHIDLTANCLDERGALTVVSPSQLHRLDAGGNLDHRLLALGGSAETYHARTPPLKQLDVARAPRRRDVEFVLDVLAVDEAEHGQGFRINSWRCCTNQL
ncbi:hypothetical protein J4G43_045675 [Bradyrhizobium barranii subsp. barranii]|uniref:Uncharacterized protein n=1 Tax=Bradyrhizobium barranii subsp. barranii TaxID=2823807 RepID=A0A939MHW4_9BRAD|nr:hypothetical protein [Bradyrhizobium barranii]UEM11671.1 hypothetical protein J4G43_045675 [Bradyrhizobium barranii subsp. barranii]